MPKVNNRNDAGRAIEAIKGDFRNFLFLTWKFLGLPQPTPIQYDIANYLQDGPKRRIVEAFRGVGKSWITAAYVCWRLLGDPQLKIEIVSASKSLADNMSTFILQLIRGMEILKHLEPRPDQRNSKIQFDVAPARESKDPSVKSVGITGQITGTRADIIIADDIEVPGNSQTQAAREKLAELVKEFDAVLKPLPSSEIIYLGTPQTEESLYNKLLDRGYDARIWPVRMPDERQLTHYGRYLSPYIASLDLAVGEPTEPLRFGHEELAERELSYGKAGFALQFMLDTSLADVDRYPLKLADLIVTEVNPETGPEKLIWSNHPDLELKDIPNVGFRGDRIHRPLRIEGDFLPWTGTTMAIDPSGRGTDELAFAVGHMLNGYIHVSRVEGLQGGYEQKNLEYIVDTCKKLQVKRVIVESNFGDGMFVSLLKPVFTTRGYPVQIEEVRHSKQKELRIIDTLEPVLQRHRLVIDPEMLRHDMRTAQRYPADTQRSYMLAYQLTHITRERGSLLHDDRLDALAILVADWVKAMEADENRNMERRRERIRDEQLRQFVRAYGRVWGTNSEQPRTIHGSNRGLVRGGSMRRTNAGLLM